MATIQVSGAIRPKTDNTPVDERTRVSSVAEISNIRKPFVGMLIYCTGDGKYYKVTALNADEDAVAESGYEPLEDGLDYEQLDNKPTISDDGQGSPQIPLLGNVKVTATAAASGQTTGVAVTAGQNGVVNVAFTLEKGADGADGDDAYEVYKSTVPSGVTPMGKTDWLASLKGADGQDGAPGADAVNPFKGYYPSGVNKPDTGAVGDYLYAPPSDSQSTATATVWHFDSTQTPPWTDTGIDVSAVVALEFSSGQAVTATKIKDENGVEVQGTADVLSAAAGGALNNRVVSVENKFEHQGYEFDEVTDATTINMNINSAGQWANNQGGNGEYITVSPGDVIRLTRQTVGGFFAILKSTTTFVVGDTPAFAEGWSGRQNTATITGSETGGYGDITMPEDAAYFYVSRHPLSTGNTQDVIVSKRREVTIPGIDTEVEQLETQIVELPNKIVSETQDAPYTLETSTGCVNGETGADLAASLWTRTEFVDVSELKGKSISFLGIILITEGIKAGYAFYSERNTNSVVSCTKYDFDTTLSEGVNKWYEVVVPQNANYFRASVYNEIKDDFGIKTKSALVELIEEVAGADATISNGITHLRPDNQGQLNVVKRMRKLMDIEFTPAFDFVRAASGGGKSFFEDVFKAGVSYKGIPYSRAHRVGETGDRVSAAKYGYGGSGSDNDGTGLKIGIAVNLETFITSLSNRGTVMEIESVFDRVNHCSSLYANICAGSACAALGLNYITTNGFDNGNDTGAPTGFSNVGRISSSFDLLNLKLGDVIAKREVHTAMITDVVIENNVVKYVEVSESTTTGNGNYQLKGSAKGGIGRRVWWTSEKFIDTWSGYKVLRYNSIANVPYTPSPYVPMPDEQYGYARYSMALLPYMGNDFRYVNNAERIGRIFKLVLTVKGGNDDAKKKIVISKKVNGVWTELQDELTVDYNEWDDETHPYVYIELPTDLLQEEGEYSAFAYVNRVDEGDADYETNPNKYYTTRSWDSTNNKYKYDASTGKTDRCNWWVISSYSDLTDF